MVIVLGNYVVIIVFVDCIYNVLLFMYVNILFALRHTGYESDNEELSPS